MSLSNIVKKIDEIITDQNISRNEKISVLKSLAENYWKEVFPEYGTDAFEQITDQEMKNRWEKARLEDNVDRYDNRNQIIYVLDWPGTGGNFPWLT
ncbi:MAG: hypothetical protein AB1489_21050 [Acidobacteriota bacterium]